MENPSFEIEIDALGDQGDGIARTEQGVVFAAQTLPGERIQARRGGGPHVEVVEILEASPHRVAPPCPHFSVCGGCRFQHMTLDFMQSWKEDALHHVLAREGLNDLPFAPSFATPPHTRRRARFAARKTKQSVVLGFNKPRSAEIVDVTVCPVLLPRLQEFLGPLRGALATWLRGGESCDIQATVLPGGIDIVLIGGRALDLDSRLTLGEIAERLDIAQLSWRKWDRSPVELVAQRMPLLLRFGATEVGFPPGSFLQASVEAEAALLDFARQGVGDAARVADLFCGLGGFGLSMTQARHRCFADFDGPAIQALTHATRGMAHVVSAKRDLSRDPLSAIELDAFDAVIFDPPRGGAKAQAQQIAASACPTIVAISCDPSSFARDAKLLIEGGYRVETIALFDQFLWSPHMEVGAVFRK